MLIIQKLKLYHYFRLKSRKITIFLEILREIVPLWTEKQPYWDFSLVLELVFSVLEVSFVSVFLGAASVLVVFLSFAEAFL